MGKSLNDQHVMTIVIEKTMEQMKSHGFEIQDRTISFERGISFRVSWYGGCENV